MKSPTIAQWIFKLILPPEDAEYLLGDIEEIFNEKREKDGKLYAHWWYWGQVMINLLGFYKHFLYWKVTMLKNHLKICLRNLLKHKGYMGINITGLAFGLACCILMMLWIGDELSYNRFHKNKDHLYRVYTSVKLKDGRTNINASSMFPLAKLLSDTFPGIQLATRVAVNSGWKISQSDKHFFNDRFIFVDPSFLRMFTVQFLEGNKETALQHRQSVVLTESARRKYCGGENALGKSLRVQNKYDVVVTGVIAGLPKNSTFRFDLLFPYHLYWGPNWQESKSWGGNPLETYVLVAGGTNIMDLEKNITAQVKRKAPLPEGIEVNFHLQPLRRLHLHNLEGGGLINTLILFSLVALFILVIACINFINLATARSSNRAGEVGLRKVLGANKWDLVQQFIGESLLLTFISLIFALLLVLWFLPVMNTLLDKSLNIHMLVNTPYIAGLIAIILVTGMVAGSYPALILSSFEPVKVLKGIFSGGKKGAVVRKIMVVFQFSMAIFMIISAFILDRQLKFLNSSDLGYNKDQVMRIPLNDSLKRQFGPFKLELLNNPDIAAVTRSLQHPANIYSSALVSWQGMIPGERINMNWDVVDLDYFKTMDMKIINGRPFSKQFPSDEKNAFVVNQEAVKLMNLKNPVGTRLKMMNWEGKIIGIVKDFHFQPLKYQIKPFVFKLSPNRTDNLFLRFKPGSYPQVKEFVRKLFEKFNPGYLYYSQLVKETIARNYGSERRISRTITYFTFLAILISCLGLLGLSSFMIDRRVKEIGIRKVLGATSPGLMGILVKDFLKWVGLANLIAWPVAYITMAQILRNYAYRVSIGVGAFIFSAVLVIAISFLTISFQTLKASRTKPVEALRYE